MRALALLTICGALSAQEYAGSKACAGCHRKIYDHWLRQPMGRSMSPASEHLSKASSTVTVRSDKLHRIFEAYIENGRLMVSESGEQFRNAHPLTWAIGSGSNGFSFLVQRGNYLFQAPLSFYTRPGAWDLSPGYEFADYGFNRPVPAACINCHSGRPQAVPQTNGEYRSPPFLELAIGCENCHGPGRNHIAKQGAKTAIVNPAKLPSPVADEICMNCHQGGDTRILQPGKVEQDFRPGMRLNDVVAIFRVPRNKDSSDTDLLEHHESMRLSRCFRESGKLSCLTCHNPHAASIDYRASCLKCHTRPFAASHPARSSDCMGCHMPKREVGVIAHSALTNHRIVRRPNDPLPEEAFQGTDLIHFNKVDDKPLPVLTLMQAYGQLSDRDPMHLERFQTLLDQAWKEQPNHPLVLASLGRRALRANSLDEAIARLQAAIDQGYKASTTYEDLGEALARAGKLDEAVTVLRRGIALSPYTPVLYKSLALRLIKLERFAEAQQTLESYVALFPEDDFVRGLLKQVSAPR